MSNVELNFDGVRVRELTAEDHTAALRTVCSHATDAADALDLARMLGLVESRHRSGQCRRCGHTMSGTDFVDHVRPGAAGYCAGCYRIQLKERKTEGVS